MRYFGSVWVESRFIRVGSNTRFMCKFLYIKTGIKLPMLTIRQFWSFASLRLFGLRLRVHGKQDFDAGILVCNHVSWLDILAIQSASDVVFVAKSEVKTWY